MHYRYRLLTPRATPAVKYLLAINVGIFLIEMLLRLNLAALFGLVPAAFWKGYIWQPATYMFLHGGIVHIFFNMFVLWMFGTTLESTWGTRRFLTFYFICGIGAGLLNAAVTPGSPIPVIGSSGAIYGLLMAFGILFPEQLIYVWGILPVKAKHFVIGMGIIEFVAAVGTTQSGIAHFAHLGGMLFGFVYMKWHDWGRLISRRRDEKRRERHIRVIWDREREKQDLQKEVDDILDKIRRSGSNSLSPDENERLRKAIKRIEELENRG